MARFQYTAVDRYGELQTGEVDASGLEEARAKLAEMGLQAGDAVIEPAAEEPAAEETAVSGRLSPAEATQVGGHIADLAKAALPLGPGLRAMAEEFPGRRARRVLLRLADRLDAGMSLEATLAAEGPRVPDHLCCLLEAAARSGRFAHVVDELVALERNRVEVRHRLRLLFAYPLFLFAMILGLYGISLYVVPQFAKIYADFGAELPVLTRFMLAACSPIAGLAVFACVGTCVTLLLMAVGGRSRVAELQRMLYWLPFVGPIWRFRGLAEFSRLTRLLLELNVPLPQTLRAVAGGVREGDLRDASRRMAELVEAGIPLSEAVERLRPFPATFAPILRWGERTPALAEAFRGTAEMCEGRFRFQGLFADAIVLPLMAVVVLFAGGVFIAAFILPLISLIQKLS